MNAHPISVQIGASELSELSELRERRGLYSDFIARCTVETPTPRALAVALYEFPAATWFRMASSSIVLLRPV